MNRRDFLQGAMASMVGVSIGPLLDRFKIALPAMPEAAPAIVKPEPVADTEMPLPVGDFASSSTGTIIIPATGLWSVWASIHAPKWGLTYASTMFESHHLKQGDVIDIQSFVEGAGLYAARVG